MDIEVVGGIREIGGEHLATSGIYATEPNIDEVQVGRSWIRG